MPVPTYAFRVMSNITIGPGGEKIEKHFPYSPETNIQVLFYLVYSLVSIILIYIMLLVASDAILDNEDNYDPEEEMELVIIEINPVNRACGGLILNTTTPPHLPSTPPLPLHTQPEVHTHC